MYTCMGDTFFINNLVWKTLQVFSTITIWRQLLELYKIVWPLQASFKKYVTFNTMVQSLSILTLPLSPIHSPPSPARNGSQVKVHFVSLVPLAIKIPFKFAFEGKVCNIYEAGVVFGSIGIPGSLVGILRSCVGIGWKLHFILLDSPFQAHIFSFFNPLLGAQHKCQH